MNHPLGRITLGQLARSPDLARRGQAGAWSGAPSVEEEESSETGAATRGALLGGLNDDDSPLLLAGRLRFSSLARGDDRSSDALPSGLIVCRGESGCLCCPKRASLPSLLVKRPPLGAGFRTGLDGAQSSVSSDPTLLQMLMVSSSSSSSRRLTSSSSSSST